MMMEKEPELKALAEQMIAADPTAKKAMRFGGLGPTLAKIALADVKVAIKGTKKLANENTLTKKAK